MQSRPPEANNPPPPIEPTGFFTGIKIRPVIIGIVVDIVATMMLIGRKLGLQLAGSE